MFRDKLDFDVIELYDAKATRKALDPHDRDGFATFSQLALYVKEKVEKATGRRQRPQFDNLSMDDGEFVFRLR